MALTQNKTAIMAAALAATSMTAIPAVAAELPQTSASATSAPAIAYDGDAENMQNHRYRRNRRGVNGGDVIAGVLVLGAIAAIASSSSNNRDSNRTREPYRTNDVRYRQTQRRDSGWSSNGIDRAVEMCVDQVERGRDRVDSVDNAARDSSGWRVSGSLDSGDYFSCQIDNEGRIRSIDLGDQYSGAYQSDAGSSSDRQWTDDDYASARATTRDREYGGDTGDTATYDYGNEPRPAYPGGPLPGEEGYEASLGG